MPIRCIKEAPTSKRDQENRDLLMPSPPYMEMAEKPMLAARDLVRRIDILRWNIHLSRAGIHKLKNGQEVNPAAILQKIEMVRAEAKEVADGADALIRLKHATSVRPPLSNKPTNR